MERTEFHPELLLERHQQAALAQTCAEEGYKVIHLIARAEVDKFVLDLINSDSDDKDKIIEKHRISKTAAMLYQGITNRINHEVSKYINASQVQGQPVDPTEGSLDLGAYSDANSPLEEGDYEF